LGEQKLSDFSVGETKIGEKQSRQSNSKYNFVQYVFFNGVWGNAPDVGQFSRIFVLKVTLQSVGNPTVGSLLTVSCGKNWLSRMY